MHTTIILSLKILSIVSSAAILVGISLSMIGTYIIWKSTPLLQLPSDYALPKNLPVFSNPTYTQSTREAMQWKAQEMANWDSQEKFNFDKQLILSANNGIAKKQKKGLRISTFWLCISTIWNIGCSCTNTNTLLNINEDFRLNFILIIINLVENFEVFIYTWLFKICLCLFNPKALT